ncbi:MAG TPA: hypothetical protein VND93_15775 [Myxococcales bacterium]|nr:hypothetical protein [Myxococcales bacterium]
MHPILARYLNVDAAVEVLRREENGEVLRAEERPFAAAARAFPEHRAALLGSRGRAQGTDTQQAALVVAAHAALRALEEDAALEGPLQAAREALHREGATPAQVDQLLATLLLEEAFGYEDDPDHFDREFVRSSLEEIPELAGLTRARVDELVREFGARAEPSWAAAHELAARALFDAAWEEGPQAINPEHLTAALESLSARFPASERGRAGESLRRMLELLRDHRLVSPERARRLLAVLDAREAGEEHGGLKQ